jgi:hypothetical protein
VHRIDLTFEQVSSCIGFIRRDSNVRVDPLAQPATASYAEAAFLFCPTDHPEKSDRNCTIPLNHRKGHPAKRPSVLISTGGLSAGQSERVLDWEELDRLQTSSPAPAPSTTATNETDKDQQDQCADGGVDDRRNKAHTKMDAELRKQPAADEGADHANDNIANDPKPAALQDLTGQPPGNETDD